MTGADVRIERIDPATANPAVGPIYVEGAEPGDALAFDIHHIGVSADRGYVLVAGGFGLLPGEPPATRIYPIKDGSVVLADRWRVALDPCIGTIGVAPAPGTEHPTLVPHDHGGNLDTTDIRAGATLYLPVRTPGALLALGDPKALMGDGEVCGTGLGVPIVVEATVSVVKRWAIQRPVLCTRSEWQSVASASTLEEACRIATEDMIGLLQSVHGFVRDEAYMLISLLGHLRISQVVDPLMTVRMGVPRWMLDGLRPSKGPYEGGGSR